MSVVKLEQFKQEKQYKRYYQFSNPQSIAILHTGKHSLYFHKQYTADYIRLLSQNIYNK